MSDVENITARVGGGERNEARAGDPATILIVEHDADCADALQTLLAGLPCVGQVRTAGSTDDALDLVTADADIMAFGASYIALPDVIFIDAQLDAPESSIVEAMSTLRQLVPSAPIILLCLYPHALRDKIHTIADRCIRKDNSYRELRALVDELLCRKGQAVLSLPA